MSAINAGPSRIDIESADNSAAAVPAAVGSSSSHRRRRRRRRRTRPPAAAASSETTTDGSFRFSDTEDDSRSLHSQPGGSYEECRSSTELEGVSAISDTKRHSSSRRGSCAFSDEEEEEMVDLESGELELKVHNRAKIKECRICHLKMSVAGSGNSGGDDRSNIIELGCSCKGDLGSAHKQCAETWFKIKGNTTCEICGASAINIAGEQATEVNNGTSIATAAPTAPVVFYESRNYCHGRRIMNFLLACMIFAFIISWLFHFKILP
ncbi:hypothetical protein ACH5RR_020708 [Cinchona calisaya]|uniref:RING-CH-type domain-containing protein n=1 Tax=Cinchona calisaya TaxID=153742 RepID=A0ABD2ZG81_9GENT